MRARLASWLGLRTAIAAILGAPCMRVSAYTVLMGPGTIHPMEGFGFFQDPDFQKRLQEMAEQMQASQSLAWADNAIKLAVDMTVAAINRVNVQGTTEQQAQQIRTVMATVFPEAVTLVREARQGLS